jgi:hypothetical protein
MNLNYACHGFILFFFVVIITIACSKKEDNQKVVPCYQIIPEKVPGLKIKGDRSEKNVIANMVGFVCYVKEMYEKRLTEKPDLKGGVVIRLTVEDIGEIGRWSIERNTINDEKFIETLKQSIGPLEFDYYTGETKETEIFYPISFGN